MFKILNRLTVLFALFCSLFLSNLKAEYCFYAKNADVSSHGYLSSEQHGVAFQAADFEFPRCRVHQLSDAELVLLKSGEEKLVQSKLSAEIGMFWVPRTFYQSFAYMCYLMLVINGDSITQMADRPFPSLSKFEITLMSSVTDEDTLVKDFFAINAEYSAKIRAMSTYAEENFFAVYTKIEQLTKQMHFIINNALLDFIQENYAGGVNAFLALAQDSKFEFYKEKLQLLFDKTVFLLNMIKFNASCDGDRPIISMAKDICGTWSPKLLFDRRNVDIFMSCLDAEKAAYEKNEFLLYRGTDPISANKIDSTYSGSEEQGGKLPHCPSFGLSLLGGILHTFYCACPGLFMGARVIGYAMRVNKYDYVTQGDAYKFFYIPPVSTLLSMALHEQLSHVSTRVIIPKKQWKQNFILPSGFATIIYPRNCFYCLPFFINTINCKVSQSQSFKDAVTALAVKEAPSKGDVQVLFDTYKQNMKFTPCVNLDEASIVDETSLFPPLLAKAFQDCIQNEYEHLFQSYAKEHQVIIRNTKARANELINPHVINLIGKDARLVEKMKQERTRYGIDSLYQHSYRVAENVINLGLGIFGFTKEAIAPVIMAALLHDSQKASGSDGDHSVLGALYVQTFELLIADQDKRNLIAWLIRNHHNSGEFIRQVSGILTDKDKVAAAIQDLISCLSKPENNPHHIDLSKQNVIAAILLAAADIGACIQADPRCPDPSIRDLDQLRRVTDVMLDAVSRYCDKDKYSWFSDTTIPYLRANLFGF